MPVPLDWATTQNNLGNALSKLGERESGRVRLEEAVAAYRDALQEWTRERVPLQWAYSEHGLADALAAIAVRSNDPARLEEAIRCMNGAAEIYREGHVSQWLPVAESRSATMKAELAKMKKRVPPGQTTERQ